MLTRDVMFMPLALTQFQKENEEKVEIGHFDVFELSSVDGAIYAVFKRIPRPVVIFQSIS